MVVIKRLAVGSGCIYNTVLGQLAASD